MESSEKTTKKISTKNRNIGLDFLRVLCMIMVVLLHYLEKGGLLQEENSKGIDYTIYNILKSAAIIAVNCYVLISGYFLIKSQFKVKKILRLWGEVIFYSYTIYILLFSFGLIEFKFMELVKSIFPIISKQYWFITVYLVMYLLSPFINKLVLALEKNEFRNLLIIIIILFSIMTLLPADWNLDETGGYGIIWFICLYLIGAYIRLYISNKDIEKYHNKWLYAYFGLIIVVTIAKIMAKRMCQRFGIDAEGSKIWAYNNPIVLLEAIMLFLYCHSLKIENKFINKVILNLSPLTFAVYLIHEQIALRRILYTKILHTEICYNNSFGIIITLISVLLIFSVCIFIEYLRKNIILFIEKKIKISKGEIAKNE